MTKEPGLTDADMRARALSRWETEGGALVPAAGVSSIDESELRILARLGAALLDDWAELPPPLRRKIIQRAKTLGKAGDHAHVKERLARFLHEHRTDC